MSATQKLVKLGVAREIAELLTSNGILTPAAIRRMSEKDLKDVTGLQTKDVKDLKAKFNRG